MNRTIKNIVNLNQKLEKEIPAILQETIVELEKLVENETIVFFSFLKNDIYLSQEKPVYVSVGTKDFPDIRLGLFESISAFEKAKKFKIPKELKKTLDNLNANLYVLNEHFPKKMPSIKKQTYFSIKAVNKEGSFEFENFLTLPQFEWETHTPAKNKKNKIK